MIDKVKHKGKASSEAGGCREGLKEVVEQGFEEASQNEYLVEVGTRATRTDGSTNYEISISVKGINRSGSSFSGSAASRKRSFLPDRNISIYQVLDLLVWLKRLAKLVGL